MYSTGVRNKNRGAAENVGGTFREGGEGSDVTICSLIICFRAFVGTIFGRDIDTKQAEQGKHFVVKLCMNVSYFWPFDVSFCTP